MKRSREGGAGVMHEGTVREMEFQRDLRRRWLLGTRVQRLKQGLCCVMTAEQGEGLGNLAMVIDGADAAKLGAAIGDCDSIAKIGETVRGSETCWASSNNHDGLSDRGCHESRERIHTPAATASRRLVESLARGPNI